MKLIVGAFGKKRETFWFFGFIFGCCRMLFHFILGTPSLRVISLLFQSHSHLNFRCQSTIYIHMLHTLVNDVVEVVYMGTHSSPLVCYSRWAVFDSPCLMVIKCLIMRMFNVVAGLVETEILHILIQNNQTQNEGQQIRNVL